MYMNIFAFGPRGLCLLCMWQDTEYEDYLISKIFLFQIVNSFSSLSYLAFVKAFLNFTCSQVRATLCGEAYSLWCTDA